MIKLADLEGFKASAEFQINEIPGGAIYVVIEGEIVTWRISSDTLTTDEFQIGSKVYEASVEKKCMDEKKTLSKKVYSVRNGVYVKITATPLVDGNDEVVGAVSFAIPIVHPVVRSFQHFAPSMAEMFPEGVFIYVSDLENIVKIQKSQKFDITKIKIGDPLEESSTSSISMKTKKLAIYQDDGERFGIPAITMSYPLFDEEDENIVAGSLNIVLPKTIAKTLENSSIDLRDGLTNISSSVEQLAASASNIHTVELELSSDIKSIYNSLEEIYSISKFIKEISDETNILGLNASIEAARAGEAGRGFSIVAKEIRRLSQQTKGTVPKIREITENIKSAVEETSQKSNTTLISSEEQAAASQEITANIQKLAELSKSLSEIAKNL
ncbi:chemotaxis protein [Clostridium sp. 19966]|uniref:methyl-accepting chemotaxis protein n=1 Tax=Clostridium sp. 19966 TaxID=2768166 RepID=UPI0028DE362E|nr:methyl-accepting chemotaxis protein [Clostridium sp. 19966]MDT8719550.1 chemotaxis protein [Clostridium sp. 19966]